MSIKVLLVSPRLPQQNNNYCGDYAYTDLLLRHPPENVIYWHYEDLIAQGKAYRLNYYHSIGYRLLKWGLLPPDLWAEYIATSVKPDIIHIYGYSSVVKLHRSISPVPIILGSGTGSYSDLKYYWGWHESRIKQMRSRKRLYLRAIDAHDSSLRPERASKVLTWSQFSQSMHLDEGYVCSEQMKILPPGLLSDRDARTGLSQSDEITFLFVGRDFARKNGYMVVEAFRQVRQQHPKAELIAIGMPPDGETIQEPGIHHRHFVPREELFDALYSQADVLVLPSRAEGFGLVIVEAMSMGLAIIAVNDWAMPEIVADRQNGFLVQPNSLQDLIDSMLCLAKNPALVSKMKAESLRLFRERFSIEAHNQRLRQVYDEVLTIPFAEESPDDY